MKNDKTVRSGDASPASALALGTSTMGVFCALTGIIEIQGFLPLGIWLLGGFSIHLYAGIFALCKGNSLDAGICVYYGNYLELVGGLGFILKWVHFQFGGGIDFLLDGYLWIPLWIGLWFWSCAIFQTCPGVLDIGILFADIAFPLISLTGMGVLGAPFDTIAGFCLLGTSVSFMYLGGASMVNIALERDVFPLGKPIFLRKS
jgi:hypothetical protein